MWATGTEHRQPIGFRLTAHLHQRLAERRGAIQIGAVDFRAGLTLLPFLPMSPVDVRLILTGLLLFACVAPFFIRAGGARERRQKLEEA